MQCTSDMAYSCGVGLAVMSSWTAMDALEVPLKIGHGPHGEASVALPGVRMSEKHSF